MKDSVVDCLNKTESAVKKIYEAYYSYFQFHNLNSRPVFTTFTKVGTPEYQKEYDLWFAQNGNDLYLFCDKDKELASQTFAMATLCGTILQFAYWGIDRYSRNNKVKEGWDELVNKEKNAIKFCIGNEIQEIPKGWIIYAGRNQAMHYDQALRRFNKAIFDVLKYSYSPYFNKKFYREDFDLDKRKNNPRGAVIIHELEWDNYENYKKDMLDMLK